MEVFNAVSIEHALAVFFGKELGDRGSFYDADVFRSGHPKDLAVVVRKVADRLEKRSQKVQFTESGDGSTRARVSSSAGRLRVLADQMQKRKGDEREDYHWEIFGALVMTVHSLLDELAKQR